MTWDFPRINANVLKSIRPWQLHGIRRNLRVRAHQCASTVLSTKDSVSHRASGHPWQNLDYDSITPRAGQVSADDYNISAKLIFPPSPERERERMWGDYQQERASFSTKACWYGSWIWTGFMSGLNEWSPFLCGVDWGDRIPVLLERTQWERISLINEHRHASSTGHSAWLLCHPGQNASGSVRLPHLVLLCERRMRTQDCEYRGCSEPEEIWTSVQRRCHSSQQYIRQR